ncbi:hypothetical protein TCON_0474 [Astathelohania contejeani]|uniref:Exocyst complex component Sec3 coiled-coil domain-containing protein n=1 Tax=Astathelohania contejeani TaxID=164912 RepID=A0ABQ7I1I2_9MICR|nr:hypothetical protein TCON_0474 [Thelohania contejeani]
MSEKQQFLDNQLDMLKSTQSLIKDSLPAFQNLDRHCQSNIARLSTAQAQLHYLHNQLDSLDTQTRELDLLIRNKTMLYESLINLISQLEVSEEHFESLESRDLRKPVGPLERALGIFADFQMHAYDIRVIHERSGRVHETVERFLKRVVLFLGREMAQIPSESRGELKIHNSMYELIKKFRFVVSYCIKHKNSNYKKITGLYAKYAKKLYDHEFEYHLSLVLKVLKKGDINKYDANKYIEKIKKSLEVLLESYDIIYKCEKSFVNDVLEVEEEQYIKQIFEDVDDIISSYIYKIYEMGEVYAIVAFEEVLAGKEILDNIKKDFLKREVHKIKDGSKRKAVAKVIEILEISNIQEINEPLVETIIKEIEKLKKGEKSELELSLYKIKIGVKFKSVNSNESVNRMILNFYNKLEKEFEKSIIGYIFMDESKIIKRIKYGWELIGDDLEIRNLFRKIIYDNISDDLKNKAMQILA